MEGAGKGLLFFVCLHFSHLISFGTSSSQVMVERISVITADRRTHAEQVGDGGKVVVLGCTTQVDWVVCAVGFLFLLIFCGFYQGFQGSCLVFLVGFPTKKEPVRHLVAFCFLGKLSG